MYLKCSGKHLLTHIVCVLQEDSMEPTPSAQALLLPSITQQDCEVNAPTKSLNLLQGEDLIRALDSGTRPMSPIVMTSIG